MTSNFLGWLKLILLDALGILFILMAPLLGWLPGPGGLPLVIIGLAILSINHEWARRWLLTLKEKGLNLMDMVFRNNKILMVSYDIVTIILVIGGFATSLFWAKTILGQGLAFSAILLGLFIFLGNRKRLEVLLKIFRKHKH